MGVALLVGGFAIAPTLIATALAHRADRAAGPAHRGHGHHADRPGRGRRARRHRRRLRHRRTTAPPRRTSSAWPPEWSGRSIVPSSRGQRSGLPFHAPDGHDLRYGSRPAGGGKRAGHFVRPGLLGTGSPVAFLWAMLTFALGCIPGLGAFLVWLPIAIYLGIAEHWLKAVIMVAWGGLVVSTIDNVLYPTLVGSRLQLHTVPIFLSVLGGIIFFGVPGTGSRSPAAHNCTVLDAHLEAAGSSSIAEQGNDGPSTAV